MHSGIAINNIILGSAASLVDFGQSITNNFPTLYNMAWNPVKTSTNNATSVTASSGNASSSGQGANMTESEEKKIQAKFLFPCYRSAVFNIEFEFQNCQ